MDHKVNKCVPGGKLVVANRAQPGDVPRSFRQSHALRQQIASPAATANNPAVDILALFLQPVERTYELIRALMRSQSTHQKEIGRTLLQEAVDLMKGRGGRRR